MYTSLTTAFVSALFFQHAAASVLDKRAVAYYAPIAGGGSELDNTNNGLGEPLNVGLFQSESVYFYHVSS